MGYRRISVPTGSAIDVSDGAGRYTGGNIFAEGSNLHLRWDGTDPDATDGNLIYSGSGYTLSGMAANTGRLIALGAGAFARIQLDN